MKYSNGEQPIGTALGQEVGGIDNNGFQHDAVSSGSNQTSALPSDETNGKTSDANDKDNVVDDIYCGIGSCRPNFAQGCKNMVCFTAVLSIASLVTSALNSYITSQITTLEKHFNFSSSVSGFLMSCNDIGYLATTLFMSYYTRRIHIPRAMAVSSIVYGVAGVLCAMAFFGTIDHMTSPQKETGNSSLYFFTLTCQNKTVPDNTSCADTPVASGAIFGITEQGRSIAVCIIAIGMILQGMAKSPRQPFVITYVDDNVPKVKTAAYIGVIIGISFFGPALAFGLGAVFSSMFITLEETGMSPRDPRWLGAWWLGFLVFGGAGLFVGIPLIFFPKAMHRRRALDAFKQKQMEDKKAMQKCWHDFKGLLKSVLHLAMNPVYVCLTLASGIDLMGASGMMAFFSKYMESQFTITVSEASIIMGILNVMIACLGSALGGFLTTRLKLSPLGCLKLMIGSKIISTVIFSLGFVLGCDQPVVHMGLEKNSSGMQILSQCVQECQCDDQTYLPVCGADGKNYFSPCHAGCLSMNYMTFTDCQCMGTNESLTATGGLCVPDCTNLIPYLATICIGGFITTIIMMPTFIVSIRCVKEEDKPFAVGFGAFTGTLIGWFPGPVIFGALVDSTCILWRTTCGTTGACARYDIELFRFRYHALATGLAIITLLLFILAFIFAVCSKKTVFEAHVDEISVPTTLDTGTNRKAITGNKVDCNMQNSSDTSETYI